VIDFEPGGLTLPTKGWFGGMRVIVFIAGELEQIPQKWKPVLRSGFAQTISSRLASRPLSPNESAQAGNEENKMIIAVDGPSAAGKGTIARAIAQELGYHFLDTGALYRMVGLSMLVNHLDLADQDAAANVAATLDPTQFNDADLRREPVAAAASRISVYPQVRANLLSLQQDFAQKPPGTVLDGRDIGTVVCPDAHVKLYITASTEVRAERRYKELKAIDPKVTYEMVLADVKARDDRDTNRPVAPLLPARDAVIIDTTGLSIEEALAEAMAVVNAARQV
jgi:CMP/dCMP kinase